MDAPRIQQRTSFLVAGITERYNHSRIEGIPAQWQRFGPHIGSIPGQVGGKLYGLCFNFDDIGNFDYMCGAEVSDGSAPPEGFTHLRVAEQRYAVFTHRDHILKIKDTWNAIFGEWAKSSGYVMVNAPQFELYGEDFNPQAAIGLVEIWIPIER